MVKGLFHTGQRVPLPVSVAKNGSTLVTDSLAAGLESWLHSLGFGEPDGLSALVLNSGFCYYMTCLGVLLFHPGCDASPLQITSSIFQVALTLARNIGNSSVETETEDSILPKSTTWPPWPGLDYGFINPYQSRVH